MCGLVGFVANEGRTSDINALTMLMLSNMKRGEHASGMYFGTEVIKDSDIVDIFLSKNQIESSSLFIGHVRQATIGLKIKKQEVNIIFRLILFMVGNQQKKLIKN